MKKRKNRIVYILLGILAVLLIVILSWLLEVFVADEIAYDSLENENVSIISEDVIAVYPDEKSDIGLVFYPGAKVEFEAYLPLLIEISNKAKVNCFLVEMPFNYAFLDEDKALDIINENQEITSWYMAGHSLGSSMAGTFSEKNEDIIDGVIYLGGYIYGDYPAEKSLTIYGSLETRVDSIIDYTQNVVKIEGGNHSQFGNYGLQPGDKKAGISRETQQEITAEKIDEFINSNN